MKSGITAKSAIDGIWRRLAVENSGQVTIEWALVMAAFALPMYFVIRLCLSVLVAHDQMVTFLETIPVP